MLLSKTFRNFSWKYIWFWYVLEINDKTSKSIGLTHKLRNCLPNSFHLQIYESFVTPYLDYCYIIYDKVFEGSFQEKFESIQYIADLAITGAISGIFWEKIHFELGLESLQDRRWYKKFCVFVEYEIICYVNT